MVLSVSRAVSPLVVEDVDASKLSTSAPRRCAASWKLRRVRVDGSKNSVQIARAGEDRAMVGVAVVDEGLRAVEQRDDRVARHAFERQQVLHGRALRSLPLPLRRQGKVVDGVF